MAADTVSQAGGAGAPGWPRGGAESGPSISVPLFNGPAGRRGPHAAAAEGGRRPQHKLPEDAGDCRRPSPRAAAALRQLPERNRFFKGLASWIGFRQIRVGYEPAARAHGRSSWNVTGLLGLSIEGLTSFSVAPL